MTPREYVLARVLGEPISLGPALVLKGPTQIETQIRELRARKITRDIAWAEGENTWEEAMHAVQMYRGDLTIVTSAYHQLRAFLTFIKAAEGRKLRIWNCAAPSPMDHLFDEFRKIEEYQVRGHVATYDEGIAYLQWRDLEQAA